MKLKPIVRISSALVTFFAPILVFAQTTVVGGVSSSGGSFLGISFGGSSFAGCAGTVCGIGNMILNIINGVLVPVLFAISFIVFLYGIARAYIFSSGEPGKVSEGHKVMLWGIIAFVIMISIWGLVNVVANTFGLSGAYAPALPTSY